MPEQYQDIVLERAAGKCCGYPLCVQPLQAVNGRYKIVRSEQKVYDLTELRNYCSTTCMAFSDYFAKQLLPDPAYLRNFEKLPSFEAIPIGSTKEDLKNRIRDREVAKESAEIKALVNDYVHKRLEQIPAPTEDPYSKRVDCTAPMSLPDLQIKENATLSDPRRFTPTERAKRNAIAVEGHVPRQPSTIPSSRKSKRRVKNITRHEGDSDDEDDASSPPSVVFSASEAHTSSSSSDGDERTYTYQQPSPPPSPSDDSDTLSSGPHAGRRRKSVTWREPIQMEKIISADLPVVPKPRKERRRRRVPGGGLVTIQPPAPVVEDVDKEPPKSILVGHHVAPTAVVAAVEVKEIAAPHRPPVVAGAVFRSDAVVERGGCSASASDADDTTTGTVTQSSEDDDETAVGGALSDSGSDSGVFPKPEKTVGPAPPLSLFGTCWTLLQRLVTDGTRAVVVGKEAAAEVATAGGDDDGAVDADLDADARRKELFSARVLKACKRALRRGGVEWDCADDVLEVVDTLRVGVKEAIGKKEVEDVVAITFLKVLAMMEGNEKRVTDDKWAIMMEGTGVGVDLVDEL
ncbi:hypothetical protein HK101_005371, partial [Irineochytrium annulatum]